MSELRDDGHDVVLGEVPPFNSPDVRAGYLADQLDALLAQGHERANLVCFSQGGIDCRYLVSPQGLDRGDDVASLTTISSPHQGTAIADLIVPILNGVGDWVPGARAFVELMAEGLGRAYSELGDDSAFVAALDSMSERAMVEFNATYADHPSVDYESWASASYVAGVGLPGWRGRLEEACTDDEGVVRVLTHDFERDVMFPAFALSAPIIAHGRALDPHDGVSTVAGAHWGRFRGCLPGDHLDVVGQIDDHRPNRRTGWDYVRFYRNLAYDLAGRGY